MAVIEELHEHRFVYVWQAPVRLAHWVHVGAMAVLAVTGYYIGSPFLVATGDMSAHYIMGSIRLAHAIAATFLGLAFVLRAYWAIVGNPFSRLSGLLPLTRKRWRDFWRQLAYYLFLSTKRPEYVGHNPVAGVTYAMIYLVVLLQGLTGLALWAEFNPGGFWWRFFGWIYDWLGKNNTMRLVHHSLMWVFIAFFVLHLYLAVLNDLLEVAGINSSIVTGYKCMRNDEPEQA